ncbi:hypothetical protein ABPG74_002614 [Tetrahymena malaccensis]
MSFIKITQKNIIELICDECALNQSSLSDLISLQTIRQDHTFGNCPAVNNNIVLKEIKAILKAYSKIIEQAELQFDKITQQITSFLAQEKKNLILKIIKLREKIEKTLFKFNDEAGDGMNIGLKKQSNFDNYLNNTHLAKAFANHSLHHGGKVVQGSHFYKVEKDFIIEMRIDINEEKLQFLDYLNYKNINDQRKQMDCLRDLNHIYCQYHPYHQVSFIKISEENAFELKCDECALNESCLDDFISLQTIRYCSEDHVFGNWPPVNNNKNNNNNVLKDIKAILKVSSTLIDQIELQFDQITKQITSFLAQEKKNIILQIIKLREEIEQTLQSYQKISDISKLKQLINWNQQNIQSQIDQLKLFVSEYLNNKEKNTVILQEQVTKIKQQQISLYDFSKIQQTAQGYFNSFNIQMRDLLCLGMQHSICQLFGTFNLCNEILSCKVEVQENILQNKISIKKTNQGGQGQIYFKYDINKEKKYVVRFKFNDGAGDGINIGLVKQSNLGSRLNNTHLAKAFGNPNQFYGGKVVQGSHFYKIEKDLIVEMRIDIKEEKLQFLDYPNYKNINELNDQNKLDKNEIYYLAIQFFSNSQYETCIDLVYFEEQQN